MLTSIQWFKRASGAWPSLRGRPTTAPGLFLDPFGRPGPRFGSGMSKSDVQACATHPVNPAGATSVDGFKFACFKSARLGLRLR